MYAEQALQLEMAKEVISKKMVEPSAQWNDCAHLGDVFKASEQLICSTLGVLRSTIRCQSIRAGSEVENKLLSLSERSPTRGVD